MEGNALNEALMSGQLAARTRPDRRELTRLRAEYTNALVRGDEKVANAAIDRAVALGWDVRTIYVDLLAGAVIRIGEMWHQGEISIAHEHHATQFTMQVMTRLRAEFKPDRLSGHRAVVTSVEGEQHTLGALMVSDFMWQAGWEVDFLGADTPAADLAELVAERQHDLVVLSATTEDHLPSLRTAIEALRTLDPTPAIIVGGRAAADKAESTPDRWGADAIARDPLEAAIVARSLVEDPDDADSIDNLLERIGGRIRAARSSVGMNQAELAAGAALDRTYISAVERGRQNVTMGALLRIAAALQMSVEDLVSK